jgi:hypothetical protein
LTALRNAIQTAKIAEFSGAAETATIAGHFAPFAKFCASKGVASCPATSASVAAFVRELDFRGEDFLLRSLIAIEAAHDHFGYANPVATKAVRAALGKLYAPLPPRSWSNQEKADFSIAAPAILDAVRRREADRDRALRQAHTERDVARQELKRLRELSNPTKEKEMPIIGSKDSGKDASAMRELNAGTKEVNDRARRAGKMPQTEPGEGYGNPKKVNENPK